MIVSSVSIPHSYFHSTGEYFSSEPCLNFQVYYFEMSKSVICSRCQTPAFNAAILMIAFMKYIVPRSFIFWEPAYKIRVNVKPALKMSLAFTFVFKITLTFCKKYRNFIPPWKKVAVIHNQWKYVHVLFCLWLVFQNKYNGLLVRAG